LRSGEQLAIFNDYVIDLSKFKSNHPGGTFVIHHNIGRDVSKFFYGGYSMDINSQPHFHTNIARIVMNSLIVAKLQRNVPRFACKILERHEVNSFVQTLTFRANNVQPGMRTYYANISEIGKHYLVRRIQEPKVNRHYTISNCMRKQLYNEYLRVVEVYMRDGEKSKFNNELL
jgi:hypothetical protein